MDVFISPRVTHDTKYFWESCRRHTLQLQQCLDCGTFYWPAGRFCPYCLSENVAWKPVSGRGHVFSYVIFRRAFDPRLAIKLPYVVAVIQLEEGPKIISNVVGCDPDEVYMDMPVINTWADAEEVTIPQFMPDSEMS